MRLIRKRRLCATNCRHLHPKNGRSRLYFLCTCGVSCASSASAARAQRIADTGRSYNNQTTVNCAVGSIKFLNCAVGSIKLRQLCRREYIRPFLPTLLFMQEWRSMRLIRKRVSRATTCRHLHPKMGVPVSTSYARTTFHAPDLQAPLAQRVAD